LTTEKNVSSIGELIFEIEKIYSEQNDLLWFRGHSDKEWQLVPSIQRENYNENEQYLSNDFYIRASVSVKEKPSHDDYSGWMSLMQHFGLPTRLLDWSQSPLFATFFATNDFQKYPEQDACIWILKPGLLNESEGFGSYIYPMDTKTVREMLYPAFKPYKSTSHDVEDKIIACYPVEYNMRIYTQQSAFTVHNTLKKLTSLNVQNLLSRFIIPANAKENILKQLKTCGITLRNVYPDIEHISKELKEFYK
jgi:hypothetical protein